MILSMKKQRDPTCYHKPNELLGIECFLDLDILLSKRVVLHSAFFKHIMKVRLMVTDSCILTRIHPPRIPDVDPLSL